MSNILNKLKRGDLIAVAHNNCTYPAIFHKKSDVSLQYHIISSTKLTWIKEVGIEKAYKNYINSPDNHYRVVKITEDSLTDEDLAIYKEMKAIYEKL
jgi:hypothetical protein